MKLSRQEDLRLVTGRGKFTADWHFDGQLHAYMVRSDHAHAKIVSIDLEQARAAPGVEAILTAQGHGQRWLWCHSQWPRFKPV